MSRPKYVASCSGGKDSVATLLLAAQHNEPLDEAVFSDVIFDNDTSGEGPEHRDFIYEMCIRDRITSIEVKTAAHRSA